MKKLSFIIILAVIVLSHSPAGAGSLQDFEGYSINDISIIGLHHSLPTVVRRELIHTVGGRFSYAHWAIERNRLEGLDIFARVSLEIVPAGDGVILQYRFTELPNFLPFPAMKQTDQDGWIVGPGIVYFNMFGTGTRLEAMARASVYPRFFNAKEYQLYMNSPWIGSLPVEYELTLIQVQTYNGLKDYRENSFLSVLDLNYRITGELRVLATAGAFRVDHATRDIFLSAKGYDLVPKLGAGLVWDNRECRLNPHRGIYQELRVSQFGGPLGGDGDYREYLFDFRGYAPIGSRHIAHLSLLGQYRPGTMGFYDYYSVGGANSLRTYEPLPSLYGKHEALGTLEYRYEFFSRRGFEILDWHLFYGVQWVMGADAAKLWNPGDAPGGGKNLYALYTGFHFLFPGFDRLRIEWGMHRGDRPSYSVEFGLTIGLYEKSCTQRRRIR